MNDDERRGMAMTTGTAGDGELVTVKKWQIVWPEYSRTTWWTTCEGQESWKMADTDLIIVRKTAVEAEN